MLSGFLLTIVVVLASAVIVPCRLFLGPVVHESVVDRELKVGECLTLYGSDCMGITPASSYDAVSSPRLIVHMGIIMLFPLRFCTIPGRFLELRVTVRRFSALRWPLAVAIVVITTASAI